MIYNKSNSLPNILHFPGKTFEEILDLIKDIDHIENEERSKEYDIVTFFDDNLNKEILILPKQLEYLKVPYINAWDYIKEEHGGEEWKFIFKLLGYKRCLEELLKSKKSKKYTLLIDARDTFFQTFDLVSTIKKYNRRVKAIFGGSKSDYPNRYGKETVKSRYPVFLNAGVIFGETKYLLKIINKALEVRETDKTIPEKLKDDDQFLLKIVQQMEENLMRVDETSAFCLNINNLTTAVIKGNKDLKDFIIC